MAYASALLRNPAQTYREIDLAGRTSNADGAALVSLLYEELIQALRVAGWAAERNQFATKSERVTRATAILFALEANLDFEKGGEVSKTLARFYAGARAEVIRASIGHDGAPFRAVADNMAEIAAAWSQVRGV
ncbi:MAG: flagellar protein FliS [Sphingomonas sp.]|nr:flagellar protein FliS [Sphingomonas sp.]